MGIVIGALKRVGSEQEGLGRLLGREYPERDENGAISDSLSESVKLETCVDVSLALGPSLYLCFRLICE